MGIIANPESLHREFNGHINYENLEGRLRKKIEEGGGLKSSEVRGYKTPIRLLSVAQYIKKEAAEKTFFLMAGVGEAAAEVEFAKITVPMVLPWPAATASLYEVSGRTLKFSLTLVISTEEATKPECNYKAKVALANKAGAKYKQLGSLGTVEVTNPPAFEDVISSATLATAPTTGTTYLIAVECSAKPKASVVATCYLDVTNE